MGRTLLSILAVIAFIWSIYIGIALVQFDANLEPSTQFTSMDNKVIVVHHVDEIIPEQLHLKENFYTQIIHNPERIQHFYFSEGRANLVLERSKPWTNSLIQRYFTRLGIDVDFESGKKFKLSNGWIGKYDRYFIQLSKIENTSSKPKINWKYIDIKSSYSTIDLLHSNSPINNYYLSTNRVINYEVLYKSGNESLVDDQDLFQGIIPADFEKYVFQSKQRIKHQFGAESPVFTWINKGMCVIEKDGEKVYISDKKQSQDPYAIFELSSDYENKRFETSFHLNFDASTKSEKKYFIEPFNNWILISTSEAAIDAILGNYEIGNTLAQSDVLDKILCNAPKEISYREINKNAHITISEFKKSTLKFSIELEKINSDKKEDEKGWTTEDPIKIETGIADILTHPDFTNYIIQDNSGQFIGISNNRIAWKHTILGTVLGKPEFLSDGVLAYSTEDGLARVDVSTGSTQFFKIQGKKIISKLNQITWKNSKKYVCFTAKSLVLFNALGNLEKEIQLPNTLAENCAFLVENQPKETSIVVFHANKKTRVSLDKRKVKTTNLDRNYTSFYRLNESAVLGLNENEIVLLNTKGVRQSSIPFNNAIIQSISSKNETVQLRNNTKLCCWNLKTNQTIQTDFSQKQNQLIDFSFFDGQVFTAKLDLINNDIEFMTSIKSSLSGKHVEGAVTLKWIAKNNELSLLTQSNDFLLRYNIKPIKNDK